MKKFLLLLLTVATFAIASAQTRTVTGKVVSAEDDEPLAGVSVLPVGGGMGTSTNEEGDFTIKVNANVKKLRFTYVGMHTIEAEIADAPLLVKMVSTDNTLDEVMVVAYGTAKRSAYTGAASVVDASVIEDRLVSNVTNALSGVVAGVQTLSSNGQPGTSSTVRIRGVGSINASMNPLYVLDGIPYDGDISSINPSDIDQMTVLKDAAAAALYGARGANGVILITTKSGKQGKTNVTLDMKWGANSRQVTNYDVISSPAEYMELTYAAQRNAAIYNLGYTPSAAHAYGNSQLFKAIGYRVFTTPDGENLIMPNGKINPNATLGYSNGVNYFTPDDWADVSFRNGLRQEYNVGISGASEKFNYYLSANYLEDEGVIDNSSFNRISTRLNVDYNVTKWLKVGANISYAYSKSQYPDEQTSTASSGNAFMIANTIAPVYPIYVRNADGTIAFNKEYGHNIYDYGDGKSTAYSRQFYPMANPAGQLVYDRERYLTDLFNGKWYAQLNPVKGLTITGTVGTTIDNTRYNMVSNPLYGQFAEGGGQALQQSERISALNLQGLINYNKTFNELHTIDILLGYESYEQHDEYVYAIGSGLYNPTNWTVNNTLANNQRKGYGSYGEYATRGFFGRVNYDYNETYFGSVSYRRDASSRFHPDNRWGNFWSISAAWNIANESFLKDQTSWLNQLKLRASFGQQGNDGIGNNYAYLDQYQITGEDTWSDGKLVYKGNKDLTWETSNSFNVGVDFGFWDRKLSGTVEYFNRQTSDMLYNRPTSPSLGYTSIPMNIGSMRNSGFEIELTYRPITTKNLVWAINANATFVNNKVLKLAPELGGKWINGSRIYREGESMYQLYMVKYAGVDKATGEALYWGFDTDDNGDKVPGSDFVTKEWKSAYRQSTGDLLPIVYGGFGTTLNAYGFDLGLAFSYQLGGKIYDQGYQYLMGSGASSEYGHNWHKDIRNAWTPENPNTNVPRLDAQAAYSYYSYLCDRGLITSNYLSLNNITLGYTLPSNFTKKFGVESLRIYGAADNVALWSARKGLDPRQSFTAATTSLYTALRCISGGLKVTF